MRRGLARERLLERDLEIVAQVRAALAARRAAAPRPRCAAAPSPKRSSKMSDMKAANSLPNRGRPPPPWLKAAWPKRS